MGGYDFNNIGGQVKNKIEFLSSYKFSISKENSEGDGYRKNNRIFYSRNYPYILWGLYDR